MKDTYPKNKERKGVALIISVGVLALIAMIATSFAINMQIEYRGALNYLYSARAEAMAQAGIDKVVADIRGWVANNDYNTVIANINSYSTAETALGDGFYQITIGDTPLWREDQKININAFDETDSPWVDLLLGAGLTVTDIGRIIDYRDMDSTEVTELLTSAGPVPVTGLGSNELSSKNATYATVEELRLVLNDDTKYNAIKNMVTVYAPIIKGGLIGEYHTDRATFDKDTILGLSKYRGKVVELGAIRDALSAQDSDGNWGPWGTFPGADGMYYGWLEAGDAEWAGGYIAADFAQGGPGLDQFGVIFTGFIYIPQDKINQNITFYKRSDDGTRLFIDGDAIIDDWVDRQQDFQPGMPGSKIFNHAGWHPIRIEYFDNPLFNGVELRWDALGSIDYVPAEYLGYYPASYYGKQYDYFANAFYAPTTTTGTLYMDPSDPNGLGGYNSAGIVKITSEGRVKRSDGTLLAEKQITTIIRVFDSLTNKTRAEFSAPWFSLYNDFSDGEIRNVTWLDSCPTDTDYWDSAAKKMHWEGSYTKVVDSLKLGFWDNCDDDVAYTVVNFMGDRWTKMYGVAWWKDVTYDPDGIPGSGDETTVSIPGGYIWPAAETIQLSYDEINNNEGANGTHCVKIVTGGYDGINNYVEDKLTQINGSYYSPSAELGYDVFVRSWIHDNGQQQTNSPNWNLGPGYRNEGGGPSPNPYCHPPSWLTGRLIIKETPWPFFVWPPPLSFYTLLKQGDSWDIWNGDLSEIDAPSYQAVDATYGTDTGNNNNNAYVLAAVGVGATYQSYYSYLVTPALNGNFVAGAGNNVADPTAVGVVKLQGVNIYTVDTRSPEGDYWWNKVYARGANWFGCTSTNVNDFDDIRIIYPSGYLVSAPFVSAYSTDNATTTWATISWTADTPSNTAVTMYARAADSLPTTDSSWTSVNNGASLSALTGKKIQYKAVLSTTALSSGSSVTDYQNSSTTPVLRNVTITYLTPVQVLYRQ